MPLAIPSKFGITINHIKPTVDNVTEVEAVAKKSKLSNV